MPAKVSTTTPPHDPGYGSHMSPSHINYIVSSLYPNYSAKATEAPRGVSLGSRIYLLEIAPSLPTPSPATSKPFQAVLKVCGQHFNHTKIQNEVAALFLLARYCPSVPVPRVMAWSEDGVTITTFDQRIPNSSPGAVGAEKPRPWILVTQPPGRPLTTADLDSAAGPSIIAQIAQHNELWRRSIPSGPKFGNLRFRTASPPSNSLPPHETLSIEGFLQCRYRPVFPPVTSVFEYYRCMLKDQIQKVMSSRPYDDVRCDLVPIVAEFIERDLLYLSCVRPNAQDSKEAIAPVFSNLDLSPRSIYVQEGPNAQFTVTGIVNFEFAAFLPETDEFVNEVIRQEGDWLDRHYKILITELARLGCKVPPLAGLPKDIENKFSEQEWAESCLLWKLIDNIAPCCVTEGNPDNANYIQHAGRVVRNSIDQLAWMRPQRSVQNLRNGLVVNFQMGSQQHQQQNSQSDSQTAWQLPSQQRSTANTATTTAASPRTPTPTSSPATTTTISPSTVARTVIHPTEL